MEQVVFHDWKLNEVEAFELQRQFAGRVERNDRLDNVNTVTGVDVAYDEQSDRLVAAAVVLDAASLTVIEQAIAEDVAQFPYIPGLFSFRELPPIAKVLSQLKCKPDLIICDGQGIAHPRRFGLACHVGILFDVPTIGCGKTLLRGTHEAVGTTRGDYAPLVDDGEIVGRALRTQNGIKPVYVSTGHRVSLPTACAWTLTLCTKYRLPETTRRADQLVKSLLRR
ncbi:deoxyribonuclease V [Chitinivorax sp. B]|uniref:deoxyribonuclease V n=1 Tax=Chitinivorax sp. B TaxID=2502235 RepID=UPI0010F6F8FF|nr:deoxyribonuclease V [Chitinivorax sp. B]